MSGDIFEMPAGTAAMAVGFHYREDEILDAPGGIVLLRGPDGAPLLDEDGNTTSNAWQDDAAGITRGDDSTVAVFAEIDIPLLADKPLIQYLDFNASVRYTDVDSYGTTPRTRWV